jgi:hypothetical protein
MRGDHTHRNHPGLAELHRYPLLSALAERRSRRVSRGTSILAGPLSHHSVNQPAPLSALEEAVLIVTTGLTGFMLHDGPLDLPRGGKELGTPMVQTPARAAGSPDNTQATSFFLINDSGVWLIRKLKKQEALQLLAAVPPRWADWSEADWLAAAAAVKQQVYKERLEFPRRFPYYHVWNKQLSNRPGTSILLPIVDTTRSMIAVMLNLLSEPDGERALFLDDWRPFVPRTLGDLAAKIASILGLLPERIPYQPIGGIKWARNGYLNPKIRLPLGLTQTFRTDYEALFLVQNLQLVAQALGLGAWVHAAIFPPYIYERDPDRGIFGLGFRMQKPGSSWRRWPPLPSPLPNPVGIDGVLEALCPPYIGKMDDAVDWVLEEKYGSQGTYTDAARFARTYRRVDDAEAFLRYAQPHPARTIEYVKVICNYIYDTYGRFPAHVDAFHLPGVWVQCSHLELEYYDRYFRPELYSRQASHETVWGDHSPDH